MLAHRFPSSHVSGLIPDTESNHAACISDDANPTKLGEAPWLLGPPGDSYEPTEPEWRIKHETLEVEIDPKLAEAIRSRSRLRQITLRVGMEQIEEARRVAARTGVPYQAVLRRWLAEGASLARSLRKTG
jgi:predicted DNA binding CopG/RHH family protein